MPGHPAQAETFPGLADPEAIDSLLDILPEEAPSITALAIAAQVKRTETRRSNRVSVLAKAAAFSVSLAGFLACWLAGSRYVPPEERPNRVPPGFVMFHGLYGLGFDAEFFESIMDTTRGSVWDEAPGEAPQDIDRLEINSAGFDSAAIESIRKSLLANDFSRTANELEPWRILAGRIASLPDEEAAIVRNRFAAMRRTVSGMSEADRKRAEKFKGIERQDFFEQKAQQQRRLADLPKRPLFSVSELNRPDYLMDLALVTRAWSRLTPAQKKAAERRALSAKPDPARKTERLRLLAQSLEGDSPEPAAGKPAAGRNGPLQRALAKAEAFKQEREKRRAEFQKIMAGNLPLETPADALEAFLDRLPPWLIESVEPLPPDEARRLLSLLKILVGNLDESHD